MTRLIERWVDCREVRRKPAQRPNYAYRTTGIALVDGKNGSVIRKLIGHGPITAEHAEAFQKFYTATLNPT